MSLILFQYCLTLNKEPYFQKQPSRGVVVKRCSENMQQICRRTTISKCYFNKVSRHGCSLVNLLNIYSTPFPKNTAAWLLLSMYTCVRQKSNQFTFHYETFIRKQQISLDNKFSALTTFSCIYLKSAHSLF